MSEEFKPLSLDPLDPAVEREACLVFFDRLRISKKLPKNADLSWFRNHDKYEGCIQKEINFRNNYNKIHS